MDDAKNKYIVETQNIRDFDPHDFDATATYNVWWEPTD